MASSELSWTESDAFVNQIAEYQIFRADKVGSAAIGPFALIGTNVVTRAFDGEITNPVSSLVFSDGTVDFGTEAYQYRIDAIPVFVGEAPSPQTPPGRSNILGLGTQPSASVLSGNEVGDDVVLTWTASTPALNPIAFCTVFRSLGGAAFVAIATVPDPTLTFTDTDVDTSAGTVDYKVTCTDEVGIESDDSNTVSFGNTVPVIVVIDGGSSVDNERVATSRDGITFELQPTPSNNLKDVTYAEELGLFCAVGDNGFVMTSPDGFDWTQQTSGNGQDWRSVTWSPDLTLFAAVSRDGVTNRVMTSPDGITWTLRPSPDTQTWEHIEWVPFLDLFVAGHGQNTSTSIMTSPDGLVWTARTTPLSAVQQVNDIGFSDVVVATSNSASADGYITSPDAITWTGRDPGDVNGFTGIAFGNGVWIRIDPFGPTDDVHLSSDPTNPAGWSDGTSQGNNANDVRFHPLLDLWLIVSNTDEYTISTDNGATWAARQSFPAKAPNGNWVRSVEGTQLTNPVQQEMVMVENNAASPEAALSFNGIQWENNPTAFPFRLDDVAWSSPLGLYAAVGDGVCVTSPDGIVWTSRSVPSNDWQVVYWDDSNALFIAAALDALVTDNIMTSPDGITWTPRVTPDGWAGFAIVSDGAGKLVACGFDNVTNPVGNNLFSSDGLTWSLGSDPGQAINAVAYDTTRSRFVQIQNDGECNVSSDGETWTLDINTGDIGAGLNAARSGMDYSAALDQLVFVGDTGLFSSEDGGASWTLRDGNDYQDVVYSTVLSLWIAVNDASPRIKTSVDGITWTQRFPGTETWVSIALGDQI